ncbi:uncharacterized protein LOC127849786 [Dreissena polymorpha]|uniref:uncharacterized protein LOC127849786 n=1 Tax=Dreissena polymorpha TaxID=45954 RepID=UPI002264F5BB|nr:uncharacterized protein LOC127849786 [Dreissena polymorpha]
MNDDSEGTSTLTKKSSDKTEGQVEQLKELLVVTYMVRLSNLLSSRLRDNNPNIADLSDKFRQTRIAELLTELFDNEWTDDLSALEQQYTEKQGVTFLLDIIMALTRNQHWCTLEAYAFCKKELTESWNYVLKHFLIENDTVTEKSLRDSRKKKFLD